MRELLSKVLSYYSTVLDNMVGGDLASNSMGRMGRNDRPKGLTIIAILQMIVGLLAFAALLYINYLLANAPVYMDGGAAVLEVFINFGLIIAGAFSLVLGYGIWKGWKWTWWAVMILAAFGIVYSIYSLIPVGLPSLNSYAFALSRTIPVVVVCSIELWYFNRKRTKDYFEKQKQPET
jgi:lysylphosphatidylglycerol synthetase-like protein (DUF2156 family)